MLSVSLLSLLTGKNLTERVFRGCHPYTTTGISHARTYCAQETVARMTHVYFLSSKVPVSAKCLTAAKFNSGAMKGEGRVRWYSESTSMSRPPRSRMVLMMFGSVPAGSDQTSKYPCSSANGMM